MELSLPFIEYLKIMDLFDLSQFGVAIFSMGVLAYVVKKSLCFMKNLVEIHREESENCNKIISNHIHENASAMKNMTNSNTELRAVVKELLGFLRKSNGK